MSEATIDPAAIRWRVGQISKKDPHKGSLLGYIDARTAMEALDQLDPEWSAVHGDPIIIGGALMGVPCSVTVNGVTRSDVGMPSSQEPIKGAYSDALKRAAVHHGIGRELYELPRIYVKLDEYKKPVATPTYRNGRWTLPSGMGSVFYDREPEDQPEHRGPAKAASSPSGAPVQTDGALRDAVAAAAAEHHVGTARLSLIADAVGVPKGQRANADQLRAILARIETPQPEVAPSDAATAQGSGVEAVSPGTPPDPAPAPSIEDILTVTGGTVVPPTPGTAAYRALATGVERAAAKAYHEAHPEDAPTLAEQLQVPA